jgi:hypothetical protein
VRQRKNGLLATQVMAMTGGGGMEWRKTDVERILSKRGHLVRGGLGFGISGRGRLVRGRAGSQARRFWLFFFRSEVILSLSVKP